MNLLFTVLLILSYSFSQAQTVEKENSLADTTRSYLNELVISANRISESRRNVAQQISFIGSATINSLNAQNSAEIISNSGIAAMQKSQQGGGSPMLRGFEASRILLVIDGVRMNNAIYRSGHLQNIITMDNNILERAEILLGPSSTVYGSDALGGVIHFFTRNPEVSKNESFQTKGNAFFRYGSINAEKTWHVDLNLGGQKFASLTSFTFSDFGDLRMGERTNKALGKQFGLRPKYAVRADDNSSDMLVTNSDSFKQVASGFKQFDVLQKFLFASGSRAKHLVNFQFSNSTDIPRYDRLTDPQGSGLKFIEWYYGPQKRLMGSYNLSMSELGAFAEDMSATLSFQDVEESRHDRRFNSTNRNDRYERIYVWGLTIDFNKTIGKNNLRYGIDGQFNSLESTAHTTNIITGAESPLDTRYPNGDNVMNTLATFVSHTLRIGDSWTLNDGVRVGGSFLHSTFIDKTLFPFPYDEVIQNNLVGSGNLGLIYTPSSWKISLMASSGYRAPNIDDMSKVFESVAGTSTKPGILVAPNPDLKPEKTINSDLSITKFFSDKIRLESVVFATSFYDAIATMPTTFNGLSQIIYDGFPSNVVSSQNVSGAYLYGFNSTLRADVTDKFAITASYNYTHGSVKNERGPETRLDHIPPIFGRIGFQFNSARFKSELYSNFSAWKYLSQYSSSGEDNLQYATAGGMPSWYTINLRAGYNINKTFVIQIGVDNMLDLQYRTFASGINSPGRNIFGTLRVAF
ncbi:MAG: TonB-dependent receptor [Bacteroidia bacterium]|nr:TonB-dependent receptor [Bacteroidia bacterium]